MRLAVSPSRALTSRISFLHNYAKIEATKRRSDEATKRRLTVFLGRYDESANRLGDGKRYDDTTIFGLFFNGKQGGGAAALTDRRNAATTKKKKKKSRGKFGIARKMYYFCEKLKYIHERD